MSGVVWQCTSCGNNLAGNPLRCPNCGWTIYKPTYPTTPPATEHPKRKDTP